MLIVTSPQVALGIEDPDVRRLVRTRFHQITDGEPYDYDRHGELIVVEPGDTRGGPGGGERLRDPAQPFRQHALRRPGLLADFRSASKITWAATRSWSILSDDGFGRRAYSSQSSRASTAELLAMCARHAQPARS